VELVKKTPDFSVGREAEKLVGRKLLESCHRSKRSKWLQKVFPCFLNGFQ